MQNKIQIILMILLAGLVFNGCRGGKMENTQMKIQLIKDIDAAQWDNLVQKKIYFGHQSVGNNIMDGVRDLIKENSQLKFNIVESHDSEDFKSYVFAHSDVGRNINPDSKISEFSQFMENGLGNRADIAFLKFCFVDIHSNTDLEQVFANYKTTMASLRKKFPKTTFVHFTVPLTSNPTGPKALLKAVKVLIKNMIGRVEMYDNTVKFKFNEMLRNEYVGKEPLFDLAKYEATNANGEVLTYKKKDKIVAYALRNEYTNDGGHLDETGRKFIAEQFLLFLLNLK